jgi:UDPglucose 6-dehydrogenase
VTVVDLNAARIAAWNDPDLSRLPVVEPGLDAVVARAIGSDSRLSAKFLKTGPGFGGSCFQNNILILVVLCGHDGLHEVQHRISRLVVNRLFGTVSSKRIAVLGFAFKADTNVTPRSRRL